LRRIAEDLEYFAKFLVEEVEKWGKAIRAANIKAQ